MIRQTMIGVAGAAVALFFTLDAPAQWPGWRGPERNGRSADAGPLEEWPEGGPLLAWKVEGIGRGWSNVAVADGSVYIAVDQDEELKLTSCAIATRTSFRTRT